MARHSYTYEEVYNIFKKENCILLSKEYKNNYTKMDYICSCGNPSEVSLGNFLLGTRCKKCASEYSASLKRHKYEDIFNFFYQYGFLLLDGEYTSRKKKLNIKCLKCGKSYSPTYNNFKKKPIKCEKCKKIKQLKDAKLIFEQNGCVLLATEYNTSLTPMKYICECGRKSKISLSSFKNGSRCKKCGNKKMGVKQTFSFDYVKQYIEDNNCILISNKYIKATHKLDAICSCGNPMKISFEQFQKGIRCLECNTKKVSGENSCRWKGGISSLNSFLRHHILDWKKDSMKECNYKCVITGKKMEVIHHLYSFNMIIEETVKIVYLPIYEEVNMYTDQELKLFKETILELHYKYGLGVCLTKKTHDLFHQLYGRGDNTPEQFEEFKKYLFKSPSEGDFLISQVS